eukprot:1974749-Amphidinium_carterae.2
MRKENHEGETLYYFVACQCPLCRACACFANGMGMGALIPNVKACNVISYEAWRQCYLDVLCVTSVP